MILKGLKMNLSIAEANEIIAEVKARDTAIGRDMSRWWMYENHIQTAARVARTIASKIKGMNPEQAYINALLHDVSRTNERKEGRFHGILGYEKLINKDENAARSALLHMFPWNNLPAYEQCSKMFFENKKDYCFIQNYIKNTQMTDADLLTQLADSLANKTGFVTLEQRAKEYSERHKVAICKEDMEVHYRLKAYFDKKVGCDIYNLFTKMSTQTKER